MSFIAQSPTNQGMFLPESFIFDSNTILNLDANSREMKLFFVRLSQTINQMAIATNKKEIGYYPLEEFVSGKLYYPLNASPGQQFRGGFRRTYSTAALGAGVTNVPHGLTIDTTWKFVEIYGVANDSVGKNYYPMATTNLTLFVNATNIVITNGTGINFTSSSIVLEYAKE